MSELNHDKVVTIALDDTEQETTIGELKTKWIKDGEDPDWVESLLGLLQKQGQIAVRGVLYQVD
jgi:hypothetical protein